MVWGYSKGTTTATFSCVRKVVLGGRSGKDKQGRWKARESSSSASSGSD